MIELQQGSFRGVGFTFQDTSRKSGRKSVFHTFPNSDIVLAEDLGRLPRVISMNILSHGTSEAQVVNGETFIPNDYYARRDAIIETLEQKGPGELVHPTYGTITVQMEGGYTINENLREINVARITVSFVMINDADFLPTDTFSVIGIPNASDEINEAVGGILDSGIDFTSVEGWNTISGNVTNVIEFGTDVLRFIQDPDLFNSLSVALRNLVTFYVPNLVVLGDTLTSVFDEIEASIDDPRDTFNSYVSLFDYNDDVIEALPAPTTQALATQAENEESFRQFVQTEALTHAINAAVNLTFKTEDDLNEVSDIIFDQQDKVLELPLTTTELYNDIQEQRVDFNNFIRDQQQNVLRVIEVPVRNESLTTLVYRYYQSLDNYQLIQDLNNFEDPSLLSGTAKIVTDA